MQVHPDPAPDYVADAWRAALEDAGMTPHDVALLWRDGRPRPTGQEAASWMAEADIAPEFDDDLEVAPTLEWANSDRIRGLPRVMIWVRRTREELAGLLRHELEHTVQTATHGELEHLHQRAFDEIRKRSGTGKSYNAIPMEVDANRAAARFLRRRYGSDRLRQLVDAGDVDPSCFRPTEDPDDLDTLPDRMRAFVLSAMHEDDFVRDLEAAPAET